MVKDDKRNEADPLAQVDVGNARERRFSSMPKTMAVEPQRISRPTG